MGIIEPSYTVIACSVAEPVVHPVPHGRTVGSAPRSLAPPSKGIVLSNRALIKKTEAHRDAFERLRDRILDASDDRNILSLTDRIEVLLDELAEALNDDDTGEDSEDDQDDDH
jgi:hypothetical protein